MNAPIINGEISTYGGGGYVKDLADNKADSMAIFNDLMANTWLDRGTRVVFLDFTLYNANINLFCQIRYRFKQYLLKISTLYYTFSILKIDLGISGNWWNRTDLVV